MVSVKRHASHCRMKTVFSMLEGCHHGFTAQDESRTKIGDYRGHLVVHAGNVSLNVLPDPLITLCARDSTAGGEV